MSLLGFQRAMAELAASPELCRAVRASPEEALAGHDLTPLERRRVASAAAQPGMVVNCTLHRSNRISSILALLPLTVHLVGAELRRVADGFWAEHPNPDFTTRRELHRFGVFLRRALDEGTLEQPFLREVVNFELHQYDLGMLPRKRTLAAVEEAAARNPDGPVALHPMVRVARFGHDPAVLLPRVMAKEPLPYADVPEGEFYLLMDVRGEERQILPMELAWGRVLAGIADGTEEAPAEKVEALLEAGLLVRTAPAPAEEDAARTEALVEVGAA